MRRLELLYFDLISFFKSSELVLVTSLAAAPVLCDVQVSHKIYDYFPQEKNKYKMNTESESEEKKKQITFCTQPTIVF